MNATYTLSDTCTLFHADCRDAMKALPDNCLDSVVTDPPYHLTSIVKRFGKPGSAPAQFGTDGAFARASRGFMSKEWDGGDIAFQVATWAEVLRVLKPGGHLAAFGGSRGYHRMACAIEDAGFEIRDSLMFLYGTGFPKSHDVSKGIDRRKDWKSLEQLGTAIKTARNVLGISQTEAARRVGLIEQDESLGGGGFMWFETGRMPTRDEWPRIKIALALSDEFDESFEAAERETIGQHRVTGPGTNMRNGLGGEQDELIGDITVSKSALALEWEGWGTALKPAFEPIVLARKPLSEGTVAANVLKWRTGAINVGACRVPSADGDAPVSWETPRGGIWRTDAAAKAELVTTGQGRWPANVVHDGSDEVIGAFPRAGGQQGAVSGDEPSDASVGVVTGKRARVASGAPRGDSGSAARFFYSAKASRADRNGSKHPTVKPIALMQWLARLITPPGGIILDPFAGSGTTGAAAAREGFRCILVEREAEYVADIVRRLGPVDSPPLAPTSP